MRSRNDLPGSCVTSITRRSERSFVPPVTAERSPPDSRITGADSPVIADSSTEPTPSMISPSAGMISPASTMTTSPRWSSAAGTERPSRRRAFVVVRVARSASACALPRPSAIASAKFAKSTVSQSQTAITPTNHSCPVRPRTRSRTKIAVVTTLPSSTMNITGFLTCRRGSSFGNESRIAASTSSRREDASLCHSGSIECEVELEDVDARLAEEAEAAAVGVLLDQLLDGREGQMADGRDATRLERGVGRRDVGIDAGARRRHGVDGNVVDREPRVVRPLELEDRLGVLRDELREIRARRPEVQEGRRARVVRRRRPRRTLVEVARPGEALGGELRADDVPVAVDQAAVDLAREGNRREGRSSAPGTRSRTRLLRARRRSRNGRGAVISASALRRSGRASAPARS